MSNTPKWVLKPESWSDPSKVEVVLDGDDRVLLIVGHLMQSPDEIEPPPFRREFARVISAANNEQALRTRNAALVAMLRELEWCVENALGQKSCVVCGASVRDDAGHWPDCRLAALVREGEGKNDG